MQVKWEVENNSFWNESGKKIAIRNLIVSSATLMFAFMVWIIWSAMAIYLKQVNLEITDSDVYWLTAIPLFSAAILRIPYSFIVPWVGGGRWNTISIALLLIPLGATWACFYFSLSKSFYYMAAFFTGIAGANFASSCSNITFLFPYRLKSIALGINSSLGNLGVGVGQWFIPALVLSMGSGALHFFGQGLKAHLSGSVIIMIALCLILTILSLIFMDNVPIKKLSLENQLAVLKDPECWNICLLYTFTFGSYIGLSAIFPFFMDKYFGQESALTYAFWGAILSSIMRPMGHVIAKYWGAVNSTLLAYALLIIGTLTLFYSLYALEGPFKFGLFISSYFCLFLGTGLGKGTTTALIPDIFYLKYYNLGKNLENATTDTSSVVGFSSAIATMGAFFMPLAFNSVASLIGIDYYAFIFFELCFIGCFLFTLRHYTQKNCKNPLYQKKNGKDLIVDSPDKMQSFLKDVA